MIDEDGGDHVPSLMELLAGRSPAVKAAEARIAGLRGQVGTAKRKPPASRTAAYLAQTGRRELTPAQQRRVNKKGR